MQATPIFGPLFTRKREMTPKVFGLAKQFLLLAVTAYANCRQIARLIPAAVSHRDNVVTLNIVGTRLRANLARPVITLVNLLSQEFPFNSLHARAAPFVTTSPKMGAFTFKFLTDLLPHLKANARSTFEAAIPRRPSGFLATLISRTKATTSYRSPIRLITAYRLPNLDSYIIPSSSCWAARLPPLDKPTYLSFGLWPRS
jgi:hypothetical protein